MTSFVIIKGQCVIVKSVGLFITKYITFITKWGKIIRNVASATEQNITTIGMELLYRYITSS